MKQKATPEAIRIEELLEKIEETRVMTEDKLHYRRQLQHMLRRLQTNQITFDAHINAMEDAMQSAIKEHDDVKSLMRQLEAGKTKAVLDLYEAQRQVSTERRDRSKVVSVRKLEAFNARKMEEWRNQLEQSHQDASSSTVQKGDLTAEEERTLRTRLEERGKLADQLKDANAVRDHATPRPLSMCQGPFHTESDSARSILAA
jgi:truncated hemoglobin YjbI